MSKRIQLSRRERQIMDVLYKLEHASVQDVKDNIPDAPSYSAVRTLLQKLLEKGHVRFKEHGKKYVYFPNVEKEKASRSAISNLVEVFFQDSYFQAVNSMLDNSLKNMSSEEVENLEKLIKSHKNKSK